MNSIQRDHCVLTGEKDLEHLYTFNNFPVYMGCTDQPAEQDVFADMAWHISKGTGCIQLNPLLPLELVYAIPHQSGQIGGLWMEHHTAFAAFIKSYFEPSSVLEIGGGHGILSILYHKYKAIPWTILEPNPQPIEECPARFVKVFFDVQYTPDRRYDSIVHSHFLEHIYEPDKMIAHMASILPAGAHLIFSLPNMEVMLQRKYTNCINFEHTVYLTDSYIEYLLSKNSLSIARKEYFKEDHSIFYAAKKTNHIYRKSTNEYEKNKNIFSDYIVYYKDLVKNINAKIVSAHIPVYQFGAHIFTQSLIAFGLDITKIERILDNDPNKQGKRLYGTDLLVASPSCLQGIGEALVILKAGVYNDEIKNDILQNYNNQILFLE
jgi:2-polyprenyl-3-methyl-5-hydroxy-6-metoxy-1,4-benzoquinol methylase